MERTLFLDELTSFDRSRLRPASSSPTSHSPSSHIKLSSSVKSTLVFDISKQFNKPENSDISIVCNDGSRIYVSSFILQARSPHFERVLQSGMKEAATKEIHIYASYEAAFALFRYFYSDSLDASPKIALEVMMLADMYLLENLRYDCESLVKRSLTVETALDLYE